MINRDCPFCQDVIPGLDMWERFNEVLHFTPLNPVTPGHLLFIPSQHIEHDDVGAGEAVQKCMKIAHSHGIGNPDVDDFNLLTSFGPASTQTVPHIHIHYIPRRKGDGLMLPWGLPHGS